MGNENVKNLLEDIADIELFDVIDADNSVEADINEDEFIDSFNEYGIRLAIAGE